MEEYICKNSIDDKPCSVKLYEHHLEWQRGDKTGTFNYTNITEVRLRRRQKKFQINIQSDYQGSIMLSNRFYVSNLKFEDRSRHYNTFVRVLHHHLKKHSTATFFTGTSGNRLAFIAAMLIFGAWIFQASLIGHDVINLWLILLDVVFLIVVALYVVSNWPRIYSAENIPLDFLPQ